MENKGRFAGIAAAVLMIGCCVGLPMLLGILGSISIAAWFSDNVAGIALVGLLAVALFILFAKLRQPGPDPEHLED